MAVAVLSTPARRPPTRNIRCSRNLSPAPHSRTPERLASAPSSSPCIPSTHRQSTSIISSRVSSESLIRTLPAAVVARSVCTPPSSREKSGSGPLKSSLKVRRSHSRSSLSVSVITDPVNSGSSKSAPATPAHKCVRFHSQLEDIKLFLARQKPLAVSRDGNPTDTSGTESEFAASIYHDRRDDDPKERPLVMHRIDVPTAPLLPEDARDVAVENIELVGTTIEGTVRVRNIAFEKWVAVRFTLDKWQTTSEVTGRYKESFQNGTFDRFMFSIKLADVLSRAEDKTLCLAVRYSVADSEIWDNNSGRDYQVRFVREKARKGDTVTEAGAGAAVVESHGEEEPLRADDLADLRRTLEELVELGCPLASKTVSAILAQESRRRCESPPPARSPPPLREATEEFLAGRYDFAASSRTPWCPPVVHQTLSPTPMRALTPRHVRSRYHGRSFRLCTSPTTAAAASEVSLLFPESDSDDPITPVPSLPSGNGDSCHGSRNHTRGGTIVLSHAPGVKRTPPTSPVAGPVALSALPHSYFDSSTPEPSIMSSSLSRSPSTSPSLSAEEPVSPTRLVSPAPHTDKEKYHSF